MHDQECRFNPEKSAIKAGYAEASARVQGYKLLQNETVLGLIAREKKKVNYIHLSKDELLDLVKAEAMGKSDSKPSDRIAATKLYAQLAGFTEETDDNKRLLKTLEAYGKSRRKNRKSNKINDKDT